MLNPDVRAVRYDLQLPLMYRPTGSYSYESSRTQNISRSGMLFPARIPLHVGMWLEVWVELISQNSSGFLFCTGPVVRVYSDDRAMFAALRIHKFKFTTSGAVIFSADSATELVTQGLN